MEDQFNNIEFKQKLARYEAAVKRGEQIYLDPEDFSDIAEYYNAEQQPEKALQAARRGTYLFPGSLYPTLFLARYALTVEKDTDKARKYAEQIDDKSDIEFVYLIAEISLTEGNTDDARHLLGMTYESLDDDEKDDCAIEIAGIFRDYGMPDDALSWLSKCEDTYATDFMELSADIYMQLADYEKCERMLHKLLDRDAYCIDYWNKLATVQGLQDHVSEAINSADFALAINPDDEDALYNKATGQQRLGNLEESLKTFKHLLDKHPDSAQGLISTTSLLISLNMTDEALKLIDNILTSDVIEDDDDKVEVYKMKAMCYSMRGQVASAMKALDKAEQVPGADTVDLNILRGFIKLKEGDTKTADQFMVQAVEESDDDPEVLYKIAVSYYDNGNHAKAYELVHKMLDTAKEPTDYGYAYLAKEALEAHDNEAYLSNLKKACEVNPIEVRAIFEDKLPELVTDGDLYNVLSKVR